MDTNLITNQFLKSVAIFNYTHQDCQMAQQATTNAFMQTIRLLHIFFCTLGTISTSLFIYVLLSSTSKHLHPNLRVSLASLAFAACLACLQLNFMAFHQIWTHFRAETPCDLLFDARKCAAFRFPVVLSIYATLCAIIVLAIERSYATWQYRTYEAEKSRFLGRVLVVIQWIVCFGLATISVILRSDHGFVHYCTAYVSHPRTAVFSLCFMSSLELLTLIYFILLLQSNQRRQVNEFVNKAMHSLSERYQLQENVRVMRILIPSITLHAILGLLGLGSMLIFAIFYRNSSNSTWIIDFAPFSEVVLLILPIYAVIFPIVAIFMSKQLRISTRRTLPFFFAAQEDEKSETLLEPPPAHTVIASRPSRQMEKESDTHFDLLNEMWKK
ncbi:unnamed protein product [Caenorhabditis angaria]|uniref:G-protein coupled receptors family 1 profile domain-containing protein n=1 Tax=Caenorhabditis angaria TaxID=860376 RepID=A0A9P1ID38_9PELO|nr:unnamed protein product [Caenorhabditis angaria]